MAFYEESTYLDLSKEMYLMDYTDLVPQATIDSFKEEGDESDGKVDFSTNAYLFFKEKDLIRRDVVNLCKWLEVVYLKDTEITEVIKNFPFQAVQNRVSLILQKYHEQPALLDKASKFITTQSMDILKRILHRYMVSFVSAVKNEQQIPEFPVHTILMLRLLNILINIRGADRVTRYFPHEAHDFEPLIFALTSQMTNKDMPWESNFVLLNWLSLILFIPFDLAILDSKVSNIFDDRLGLKDKNAGIVDVIIALCQHFLASTAIASKAAAECLGKLFSRKDIREKDFMEKYVDWAINEIEKSKDEQLKAFFVTGLYGSLDQIFKLLLREDLLKVVDRVYHKLFKHEDKCFAHSIGTVRHNRARLAQRMALCILKPKVCNWMHKRAKKSLLDNFKGTLDTSIIQTNVVALDKKSKDKASKHAEENEGLDSDVDLDILEDLIAFIFDSLKDKETVIRWTAAKAIGRITQRLDLDLADDIVNEIVDTFLHAGENEWHGGLMALGELSRRGLLLPVNLTRIIHILKKGLIFEVSQGTYTTGSNVRDAACYVAWAFSRAFEPEIMQPYVHDLASSLLLCALYDKEAGCRRAAAAAFQENVGRQGNFPRGIEIITEADYFSLGIRNNSYLLVSIFVAHYKEYYKYFVEHLAKVKLVHCDVDIRKLAAATLSLLSSMDPEFMVDEIIPYLLKLVTNSNFYVRHGAILGIGEIIIGLAGKSHEHNLKDSMKDSIFLKTMSVNERKLINPGEYMRKFLAEYEVLRKIDNTEKITADLKKEILKIVSDVEAKRLFRGKGGDQMRVVISRLIQDIAIAKLKMPKTVHNRLMDTIDENLRNSLDIIVKEAEEALLVFSNVYHKKSTEDAESYIKNFLKKAATDELISVKRGYTQALSAMSPLVITSNIDTIIEILRKNSEIVKKKAEDDPDLRNIAVKGLKRLINRLDKLVFTKERIDIVLGRLIAVMDDYSVDRRGDIGSIVRETGMYALLDIIKLYCTDEPNASEAYNPLTSEAVAQIIGILLQQLVEKIDRMRLVAGHILQIIFDKYLNNLPDFPNKAYLETIFSNKYLRERVKKDQERIEHKFDVSLVDTTFLDYHENEELVYFWDLPQCVFPLIVPIISLEVYSYYILRGLCLSLGGITVSTSDNSIKAVDEYINTYQGDKKQLGNLILDNFFRIFDKYRRVERFITPTLNTLACFYKMNGLLDDPSFEERSLKILQTLHEELIDTKFNSKLVAGATAVCAVIQTILSSSTHTVTENMEMFKSKMLPLCTHLLNHEFPVVAKAMSDGLFNLFSMEGQRVFIDNKQDRVTSYISSKDWLQIDIANLNELKSTFESLFIN